MKTSELLKEVHAMESAMTEDQEFEHMLDNHDADQCTLCEMREEIARRSLADPRP